MPDPNIAPDVGGGKGEILKSTLPDRLRAACDRSDKPSGVHMIDGQRMIARHFAAHGDEDAKCIAEVAECMAHCIENEALLFECLKTEALKAADMIERLQIDIAGYRDLAKRNNDLAKMYHAQVERYRMKYIIASGDPA